MLLKSMSAIIAIACVQAVATFAQALPAGVKKVASVEGLTEYAYPNGLRVVLFPDPSNPKVTVNMTYLVGSRHEGYGETGMAHLLEHLLFMQTTSGRDIKKELTGHGAQWNGSTWYDRTNYYETVTASEENLHWALSLESDRMVNSKMDKAMLDTEMTVVRNEFERGENSADRVLRERVVATAYLWHNYGKSTIGSRADIENVPIDRLAAFYRKYYQPDNAVLVIAGQFDDAKALNLVAETAGRISRPGRKLDPTYTSEPVQDGERYVALRRVGDGQSIMAMYHTPAAAHPDSAALEVLAGIMTGGGGFRGGGVATGRLSKALVDNKKAVSARMSSEQLHDPGFMLVSAQLSKDQSLAEARRVMLDTVENLAKEPPGKEEVERVKTRLSRTAEMQMTNSQSLALNLSEWASMGDWRLLFLNRDRIKNVTPEDVARVAKTYLIASNRTIGEFIPETNSMRAEVPSTPDLNVLFKDYKGGESIAAGETFDPTPANVEKRLKRERIGGLKIVMLPRKTRGGTVSAVLDLHFGDEISLAGKTAAAQIAGGLLMRGTQTRTREQIQDQMDKLKSRVTVSGGGGGGFGGGRRGGGGGGAVSSISDAGASIETDKENLIGALRLAVEMLREPKFADSDFEQVRQQRIAGIENGRSEPQTLAALELSRRMSTYPKGDVRYVATIDEQIAELNKVTLEDVKKFHSQFYGASSGELVLVGEFDSDSVRKAVGEFLASWKSASPYRRVTSDYKKTEPVNLKIETPDKQNALFEAGLRIQMNEDDPDYPAMLLANQMFGGSLGARMPNRIRNVEGLSYSVSSRFTAPPRGDNASFTAMAISAPANTPKVEASFKDELRKTLKSGFSAEEVEKQKKAYRDQLIVSRSQEQLLIRSIASHEQLGRTLNWDEQLEAKIQALTVERINAAFRRRIDVDAISIVKAGDFKKAGAY